MCYSRKILCILALCFLSYFGSVTACRADVTYLGDGSPGGLMPDFPQVWDQDQKQKALCMAAASADAIWYLDQHGFSGLVNHQNPNTPNNPWRDDAKNLFFDLATREYGKTYVEGKANVAGGSPLNIATGRYIQSKGFWGQQQNKAGLVTYNYSLSRATYSVWQKALNNGSVPLGTLSWRNENGVNINSYLAHLMSGAGLDSTDKSILVTHGWGDHPADKPPYKKPPYDANEVPYINQYDITINNDKKVQIPKKDGVELFKGDTYSKAAYLAMDNITVISPVQAAKVRKAQLMPGGAGKEGMDYAIENDSFTPIFQVAMQVQVPFSLADVHSPPGWTASFWDPTNTPDITPAPTFAPEPDLPFTPPTSWNPDVRGILWQDISGQPIEPGTYLDGFSFLFSDIYPIEAGADAVVMSDGLSGNPDGLASITDFADGPVPVPEPATIVLALLGSSLFLTLKRRKRRLDRVPPEANPR
jgi:hypothetical protein